MFRVEIASTILHLPEVILWQSPESIRRGLLEAGRGDILGLTLKGTKRNFFENRYSTPGIYGCVYSKPDQEEVSIWTMAYPETDPFHSKPTDFARSFGLNDVRTVMRIPAKFAIPHESLGKFTQDSATTIARGNGIIELVLIEAVFDGYAVGRAYSGYHVFAPTSEYTSVEPWFDPKLKVW